MTPTQADANGDPDVYKWCMGRTRTNIEIDDENVKTIQDRYGLKTKTEAVDLALRHLAGRRMSKEEALGMWGANAIGEIPEDVWPHLDEDQDENS